PDRRYRLPRRRSRRRTALRSDRSTSNRPGERGSSGSLSRRPAMAATRGVGASRVPRREGSAAPWGLTATRPARSGANDARPAAGEWRLRRPNAVTWVASPAAHLLSGPDQATGSLRRVTGPLTTLDLRGTDTSDPHALRSVLPRPKAAEEPPIEQVRAVIDRV